MIFFLLVFESRYFRFSVDSNAKDKRKPSNQSIPMHEFFLSVEVSFSSENFPSQALVDNSTFCV